MPSPDPASLAGFGARVLGEAAQRAGTPFFVVAESYKWLPPTQAVIAGGAFEAVPNALVTAFLCDTTPDVSFCATGP